jgi:hypothetical protein
MRNRSVRAIAAGVLLTAPLSACLSSLPVSLDPYGQEIQEIRDIDGGECFDRAFDDAIDFEKRTSCSEEHDYEVLAAIPLPDHLADVTFAEAIDVGGEANQAIQDYVGPRCSAAVREWSGVEGTVGEMPQFAADTGLWPGASGDVALMTPPEFVWGRYQAMLCVFEFVGTTGDATPVASSSEEPALSHFGTAAAPDDVRICSTIDARTGHRPVDCSEPHGSETLFMFDAENVFGTDWVSGVDIKAMTEQSWADVNGVCASAVAAVFGSERTLQDVAIRGEIFPQAWGVPLVGHGSYPMACSAYPTDPAMLLNGPVWGLGDVPATLVPAG